MATRPKSVIVASPEDFVRTWQSATSVEEVAKALKCTVNAASQRARQYRKQGVNLKRMSAKTPIPVKHLNDLIVMMENEGKETT